MLTTPRLLAATLLVVSLAAVPASAGARAPDRDDARCAEMPDQPGVTADEITLANVADITGPVPGLHLSAQQAVTAFVTYFAATGRTICGRTLALRRYDSRADGGADQQSYRDACRSTFAAIGSSSAFDSGGATAAQRCRLPDVRATIHTAARSSCRTCFSVRPTSTHRFATSVPDALVKHHRRASQHAALVYLYTDDATAASTERLKKAWTRRGMRIPVVQGIDTGELTYAPYVRLLKDRGIRLLRFDGPADATAKFARAMAQQDYRPSVFLVTEDAYSPRYAEDGGRAVDGSQVVVDFTPFEQQRGARELRRYLTWLGKTAPGAAPTVEGLYAWSAARLFTDQAAALGGELSRRALTARLRDLRGWTSRGLHARQPVGAGTVTGCSRFLRLVDGTWTPQHGTSYRCGRTLRVK